MKTATQIIKDQNIQDVSLVLKANNTPAGEHIRRYNVPSTSEVAILMPNDPIGERDIIIRSHGNTLRRISQIHQAYDPLQYPLLFPYGTHGWNLAVKIERKVTQQQFYCYQLMIRPDNYLLRARRLLQQFLVDIYSKIESERLAYLRREQTKLRADNYSSLRDTIAANDTDPHNVGCRVVLPSSFTGGPRYMFERQQDAMCYVRKYGRPDIFLTMTTNPNWTEVLDCLKNGEQSHDRPDLIVRIFKQKFNVMMKLIKSGAFGSLKAWLYSIEFQKRGLPHAHVLLWLIKDNTIHPDMIDFAVSAEIPHPEDDPELHHIVKTHMLHGPCGADNPSSVCMQNGKCTKKFPKPFLAQTEQGNDGYPKYRRRSTADGGHSVNKIFQHTEITMDNKWVVPYNPWLLRQMNCHLNVELCSSIKSIKYVLKYVHNRATASSPEFCSRGEIF